jgi:uncharacterized protein involved in type VI secretion and phage assembly
MACRKLQPPLSASPFTRPLHPFSLSVDIAGDQPDLSAADFLEKQATLTVWQGTVPQRYLHGIITGMQAGKTMTGR